VNFRWRLALWFGFLSFTSLALAQTVPASTPSAPPDAATPAYCRQVSQGVEHGDVLEQFCNWAVSLRERLPNLLCEQTTVRWRQGYGNDYRKLDTISAKVAYEDGAIRYNDLTINKKYFYGTMDQLRGAWSTGEFAYEIVSLFLPDQPIAIRFVKSEKNAFKGAYLFELTVKPEDNHSWQLSFGSGAKRTFSNPGFVARIWLLPANSQIVHLERETTDIPADFPIRWSLKTSDYANTELGDGTWFVLPTDDLTMICNSPNHRACSKNDLRFSHWHKFTSTHRILPDTPVPEQN